MSKVKNAIVLMAVGNKYKRVLEINKRMFVNYAEKCGAKIEIIEKFLDESNNAYSVLDQKLLIPSKFKKYDNIAFIDLDVIVSNNAPSIFNYCEDAPFRAVVTDLTSSKYLKTCDRYFGIKPVPDHADYFYDRGFETYDNVYSINGGVWICKPKIVGEYLKDAYFSKAGSKFNEEPCSDELFFALETQQRNHFEPLDHRFNHQLIYDIYGDDYLFEKVAKSIWFKILKKSEIFMPDLSFRNPIAYKNIIDNALNENWFVHFAGKLPFLGYKRQCDYQ